MEEIDVGAKRIKASHARSPKKPSALLSASHPLRGKVLATFLV